MCRNCTSLCSACSYSAAHWGSRENRAGSAWPPGGQDSSEATRPRPGCSETDGDPLVGSNTLWDPSILLKSITSVELFYQTGTQVCWAIKDDRLQPEEHDMNLTFRTAWRVELEGTGEAVRRQVGMGFWECSSWWGETILKKGGPEVERETTHTDWWCCCFISVLVPAFSFAGDTPCKVIQKSKQEHCFKS